ARLSIVNIAGNACPAGAFVIHASDEHRAFDPDATHRCRLKATRADSESRFLAMKKFSRLTAARRIAARQNRVFARIATTDSTTRLPVVLIQSSGKTPDIPGRAPARARNP